MAGPTDASVETTLLRVLIELIVIIAAARISGTAFRSFGQPQVCGEIAAGLLLGPSFFGKLAPDLAARIFSTAAAPVFNILSQLGLILLLFIVGLEFDFGHLRVHGRAAVAISLTGIAFPFALGLVTAAVVYPWVEAGINKLGFSLFMATALSITAIPVLGRIMMELNMHRSAIGSLTIMASAVDDACGWIILALVAAVVRSQFNPMNSLVMVLETVAYGVLMFRVVRPILKKWVHRTLEREGSNISLTTIAILIVVVFISAAITNMIGIFSVFGAFVAGATLYDEDEFRQAISLRLLDFTTVFFLPIFFTYTGLRTDIGSLHGTFLWLLCGLVLAAAVVGKLGGCTLAARFAGGLSWRDSTTIGILMNTRGLMELIVINMGYELGVIPLSVYFMLTLTAVVTTYMTTPLVRYAIRNTALEQLVETSPFILGRRRSERLRVPQ